MPTFHNQFQPRTTRATVYQLRADVLCPDGMENSFSQIIGLILPFVAKSLYTKLPPEAAEHLSFEISNEDRLCECVAVPERMLWAIRFKFASKDGTAWYYDVSLVREDDRLIFGMKIDTAFGADVKALQANLPLVGSLLGCGLLAQGRPVTANLWLVNTPEDVQELVDLLEDPYRSLPVIVISAVNRNAWRFTPTAPGYLVNAEYLANRVKGYAIVARINFQSAYALTEAVGKSWSVYDGACRTYFPKIDFDNGSPAHHPGNFKDKIWFWNYEGLRGERGYTAFLIDTAHRVASTSRTDWSGLYFVPDARILAAELEMAHAMHLANAPERELAMQNHIAALQRKLQTAEDENADWLGELEKATEEAEYYKQENIALRLRLDALRAHLIRQSGESPDKEIQIPDNYKVMGEWVKEHLAGRLILLPRAERAASKAEYTEVGMVYRALLILANEYRDSRMGTGTDKAFRDALAQYGMDFSGSIDKSRAGQEGDAYYVNYPIGTTQRVFLQFHLERGNRHEDRYCMRIYFFWDDDTNQVVVGWLPSHLSNRIS
jgi:hypothetical protein